jgi:hypothetical protein
LGTYTLKILNISTLEIDKFSNFKAWALVRALKFENEQSIFIQIKKILYDGVFFIRWAIQACEALGKCFQSSERQNVTFFIYS